MSLIRQVFQYRGACGRSRRVVLAIAFAVLGMTSVAKAQETSRVGLTMSYPARVGVLWHLSDRVGILPDVAFQRTLSTAVFGFEGLGGIETTTRSSITRLEVSPGINVLIDFATREDVTTYATAGWSHVRSNATTTQTTTTTGGIPGFAPSGTDREEFALHGYAVRSAFGVRYVPRQHFGFFGEIGIEYSKTDFDDGLASSRLGNRGAAGAVLYF